MENKILFLKNIQEGENKLMKKIIKKMREDEDNAKRVNKEKERKRDERERKRKEKEASEGKKENENKKKGNINKAKGDRWMETIDKYLEVLNMNYEAIEKKDIKEIKEIVKKYDDNKWEEKLRERPSVKIYYSRKKQIKQEKIYDNRWSSV